MLADRLSDRQPITNQSLIISAITDGIRKPLGLQLLDLVGDIASLQFSILVTYLTAKMMLKSFEIRHQNHKILVRMVCRQHSSLTLKKPRVITLKKLFEVF